jgi:ABC-type sugar transport system, periplasmic component
MKLKKVIAIAVTGGMLISGLIGCAAPARETGTVSDTQANTTENVVLDMAWWGNQVRNERTQEVLEQFAQTDGTISINSQFFQWGDYWNKLAILAAGKKLPDLIQMDHSYIGSYVEKGQLLDLKPYIESGQLDVSGIADVVLEMGEIDGGIYGIVAGMNAPCLFYNKTLLDEHGITLKDNMTLDEFIEVAKEVAEKTGYKAQYYSAAHGVDSDVWARSQGLRIVEKAMPGTVADYVNYFETYITGIQDNWHTSPEYVIDSSSVEESPLVYGSNPETMTWCTLNASNMLTSYQSAAPEGIEIAVTTIPTSNPTKSNYLKASMYFSLSADTDNPDEAIKVLNYLINSIEANEILLGERGIPAPNEVADAIINLVGESERHVFSYVNDVIIPNCSPLGAAAPDGSSEVLDTMNKLEERVAYGEITPQQAAEEYFAGGNSIYAGKQ